MCLTENLIFLLRFMDHFLNFDQSLTEHWAKTVKLIGEALSCNRWWWCPLPGRSHSEVVTSIASLSNNQQIPASLSLQTSCTAVCTRYDEHSKFHHIPDWPFLAVVVPGILFLGAKLKKKGGCSDNVGDILNSGFSKNSPRKRTLWWQGRGKSVPCRWRKLYYRWREIIVAVFYPRHSFCPVIKCFRDDS